MEYVCALSPNERTVVSRGLASWATPFKRDAANPTNVFFIVGVVVRSVCSDIPFPVGDGVPVFDRDFHGVA